MKGLSLLLVSLVVATNAFPSGPTKRANLIDLRDEDDTWSNKADEKRALLIDLRDEDDTWSNKADEKRALLIDLRDEDDTWSNKADE